MNDNPLLKKYWLNIGFNLLSIAVLSAVFFALVRAIGTIGPQQYRFVLPIGFMIMVVMPFIFLGKQGKREIGLAKSISLKYYWYAIAAGTLLALLCYGSGLLFFGTSANNWFISIKNAYFNTFDTTGMSIGSLFLIFTLPALIFSPFGEEIFFRGFLQEALIPAFSYNRAILIDALFFALIHLFHHGFVKDTAGVIHFYPWSGFLWVMLMFITAIVFAWLKKKSASLYPAIVAHIIFNLVMNLCIFYGM